MRVSKPFEKKNAFCVLLIVLAAVLALAVFAFAVFAGGTSETALASDVSAVLADDEAVASSGEASADRQAVNKPIFTTQLTFNGNSQQLSIPESDYYTVTGGVSSARNAGTYEVELTLSDYSQYFWADADVSAEVDASNPAVRTIEWKILPKAVSFVGISFADATFKQDGTKKSIQINGTLPEGFKVTYENNDQIKQGTYRVVAKFSCIDENDSGNYTVVSSSLSATMTITPPDAANTGLTQQQIIIIGSVGGAVLLLAIIFLLVGGHRRRKEKKANDEDGEDKMSKKEEKQAKKAEKKSKKADKADKK